MEPRASVAMVTGAANGIGRAIALRLRDDGFLVAAVDIEPVEPGHGLTTLQLDIADLDAHDPLVARVEQELGPLGALVNVAGIFVPEPVDRLTRDAYRRQHAGLLDGPVLLARAVSLPMADPESGRVVNSTCRAAADGWS